ncbi:MAG: hypothetical protein LBN96_00045 [Desulfovibrio sp.]|jgi:CheY-like chemotaxis protein|nr:hypothetical protein [Desulfovibrio sp.]
MSRIRVMLVDDETEIPRILSKRLTRRGDDCVAVSNCPCPLVILDVKCRSWTGMETLI